MKTPVVIAALFIIATLVFTFQTFDQFGGGNPIAGIVNLAAGFYVGRIAFRKIKEVKGVRV